MEDLTGKQLKQYQIIAPLGEGGMAAVYKAYQLGMMNRYVALKILPQQLAKSPEFVKRFNQEANILAQLQHPRILPVFDFGESDGYTYLAMPFIEGGTLADLLQGKPLPLPQVRSLTVQIAEALDYAHSRGLIHRDVKPSNVLVDERGNCLLSDFGITKILEGTEKLTSTGGIIGTPAYMSPEQGRGEDVDQRSDIYSLGVMLYEMATGRVPFKAETPLAVMIKHLQDPLPPPRSLNPALPEAVERVIFMALAKNREGRYRTAGEMGRAIQAAIPDTSSTIVADGMPTLKGDTTIDTTLVFPELPKRTMGSAPKNMPRWGWAMIGIVALITIVGSFFVFSKGADSTVSITATNQSTQVPDSTRTITETPVETNLTPTPLALESTIITPDLSKTYHIVANHSNKCLDIDGGDSDNNGAQAQQWECVGLDALNQIWSIRSRGDAFQIVSLYSQKCLDVDWNARDDNAAKIQQWDCSDSPNQLWQFVQVGESLRIVSVGSNKCLDVASEQWGEDGAKVQQWECYDDLPPNQMWHIEPTTLELSAPQVMQEITIPSNANEGTSFQVVETGWYGFQYVSGAYQAYPDSPWYSSIVVFQDSKVAWVNDMDLDYSSALFTFETGEHATEEESVEAAQRIDIIWRKFDKDEWITFVAADGKNSYDDNSGEVTLSILYVSQQNTKALFSDNFDADTTQNYSYRGSIIWNNDAKNILSNGVSGGDSLMYFPFSSENSVVVSGRVYIPAISEIGRYDSLSLAVSNGSTEYWGTIFYGNLLTEKNNVSISKNDRRSSPLYKLNIESGWYTIKLFIDKSNNTISVKTWSDGNSEPDWQVSQRLEQNWNLSFVGFRHAGDSYANMDDLYVFATP